MRFIGRRASRPKRGPEGGKPEASKVGEVTKKETKQRKKKGEEKEKEKREEKKGKEKENDRCE